MMTTGEAVRYLRTQAQYEEVVRDSYLGEDVRESAERFLASVEFAEVRALLGEHLRGGAVLDLGAGVGIASYAFAQSGAQTVYALEPDSSEIVGRGAIKNLGAEELPIKMIDGFGEEIPLDDDTIDVVYVRQVLHHTRDLPRVMRECARVLKSGGLLLACREHVVEGADELKIFLEQHPLHQLAGGEHAFSLATYTTAIQSANLRIKKVFGPWDSIINAFPEVRTQAELERVPLKILRHKLGGVGGTLAAFVPGMKRLVWQRVKRQTAPGRMYSFLASKP